MISLMVASVSTNDSVFTETESTATKCHERDTSVDEASLLRHLQRAISETTEENVTYTKETATLLTKLNVDVKALPNDIKEGLEKLALILKTEKLFEFDETALRVMRERKVIEEKRRQREEKQMSTKYDELLRNCMKLQTRLDHLQDAVDSLEKTVESTEEDKNNVYCNKVFLSTKLTEYQQAVERLGADLSDMQVDELYSEKILNKYKLYLEKTSRLAELNQSLAQYGDLPPNLLQAKLLVESKRKEYENLEQMFLEKTQ
ncbi:uncharacterized protein LOC105840170 isoform X2 [Monomorium pharaonis]|uniref:uncharacterized protein LOC105840170 isoform X2 n=1 Tax=Monomorium pharaonis TaxID=307658 RepID=UPI00102E21AF|nr:uncharacterized protein LOC105840170 isoform X2 [Monomorium pharaonis]